MKTLIAYLLSSVCTFAQSRVSPEKEAALKADMAGHIESMKNQAQVMVDSVFSFAELGFQEFETSKYLSGLLEKEGFKVERNVAGIPTAFVATWGEGKPVIALGSDIDDIPLRPVAARRESEAHEELRTAQAASQDTLEPYATLQWARSLSDPRDLAAARHHGPDTAIEQSAVHGAVWLNIKGR